jgi:hypothetical protein
MVAQPFEPAGAERVCLLLVHGTFASDVMWKNSPLVTAIPNIAEVKAIKWSGANTFRARLDAGQNICAELEGLAKDERAIVCAHSHGGSAVCYAIKSRPDLAKKISAVVFLATPFYSARLQPSWRLMLDGLFGPLAFSAFYCISSLAIILNLILSLKLGGMLQSPPPFIVFLGGLIISTFACTEVGLRCLTCVNRIKTGCALRTFRRAVRISRLVSCDVPADTHAYFVRQSGDEASAFLSIMQGISWLMGWINSIYAKALWFVARPFRMGRYHRPIATRLVVLCFTFVYLYQGVGLSIALSLRPFYSFVGAPSDTFSFILSLFWWPTWQFRLVDDMSAWREAEIVASNFSNIALAFLLLSPILFFAVSVLLFLSNWLLSLAFGAMPISLASILQPAVEATPPGNWSLYHANWSRTGRKVDAAKMRHSAPYTDPTMVADIVRWLATSAHRHDGLRPEMSPFDVIQQRKLPDVPRHK